MTVADLKRILARGLVPDDAKVYIIDNVSGNELCHVEGRGDVGLDMASGEVGIGLVPTTSVVLR